MEPDIRIDHYSRAVDASLDAAFKWVNDNRHSLDKLGPNAYNDFVLNIKTRYMEDFIDEIQTIKDSIIEVIQRPDYRTYYSAIAYNFLSYHTMLRNYIERDVFNILKTFLLKHKSRFLLQYIVERCDSTDCETYDVIKNIASTVVTNISDSEYHGLHLALMRFKDNGDNDPRSVIVNRLYNDNILLNNNNIEIEYQEINRILLLKCVNIALIEKALNDKINELLYGRGDIEHAVKRVKALNDNFLYCGYHATLTLKDVFVILSELYSDNHVIFKHTPHLYDDIENKENANQIFAIGNEQAAGFLQDEVGIDKKIKTLVNSFNSIPGVNTFSSCDGHYKNAFYVLWNMTNDNFQILNEIAKLLSNCTNETFKKYTFDSNRRPIISLNFAHNKWTALNNRNQKDLPYFEFRITMPFSGKDDRYPNVFYEFTDELSNIFAQKVKEIDWSLL